MSRYEDLSAVELRQERDEWRHRVCEFARDYRAAIDAEDVARSAGLAVALDQALTMVRRLDAYLRLGAAA